MNIIRKTNIVHISHAENKREKKETPGPGSYDIALPLIRPNFQAIHKKNDVIILKINHNGESSNFKSENQRFPDQKQRSPGPARYQQLSLNLRKDRNHQKKYSQRYTDLIQFMYRDRPRMSPVPDYQVSYNDEYSSALKRIKNSHRRYKQRISESKQLDSQKGMQKKGSVYSTSNIVNIRSTSRLSDFAEQKAKKLQNQQNQMDQICNDKSDKKDKNRKEQIRTIDFPQQSKNMITNKRPFSLQKQQKLVLHRVTLYNRNMLGMMMAKGKKQRKTKDINNGNSFRQLLLNQPSQKNFQVQSINASTIDH